MIQGRRDFSAAHLCAEEGFRRVVHATIICKDQQPWAGVSPFPPDAQSASVGLALMQLRYDGRLGFFGGMVEDGEDIVTALEREVVEEMGTASLQGRFKPVSVYEVTIPNGFFKVRKS